MLQHYINEFRRGNDIGSFDAEGLYEAIRIERDETLLVNLLECWNAKGVTGDEIFEFATIMRNRMKRINSRHATFVDSVGTGGSKAKTFNVSTAAAFVIAGAEVPVAKHGNRAATSNSGSADVLSLLGINLEVDSGIAEHCLDSLGICFMFAPLFHSLSPTLAVARRSIGRPTIFNNLGPLCNPASAPHQIIGVWDKELLDTTANALARLGTSRSWIVHGENGLDEIALNGKTHIAEINGDQITRFDLTAHDFGIEPGLDELPSRSSAEESSNVIREILSNRIKGHSAEKLVLINAAAAIYITGQGADLSEAYKIAEASIRNGAANAKMIALGYETNR